MPIINLLKLTDVPGNIIKPLVDSGILVYEATSEYREKRAEYKSGLVNIPTLGSTDIKMFKKHLKNFGLTVELQSQKPHIKYRNCLDNQIVKMNYRPGRKVEPGTYIIISYVTPKTVKESQKIYDNLIIERRKRIENLKNLVVKNKKKP